MGHKGGFTELSISVTISSDPCLSSANSLPETLQLSRIRESLIDDLSFSNVLHQKTTMDFLCLPESLSSLFLFGHRYLALFEIHAQLLFSLREYLMFSLLQKTSAHVPFAIFKPSV